jgi:hypothetical protein
MAQADDNTAARIRTAVVGSYPCPDWLALLSERGQLDATRVL